MTRCNNIFTKLFVYFLVFCIVFGFPILPGLSSAKAIFIFVITEFLLRKDFKRVLYKCVVSLGHPFLYSCVIIFFLTCLMPILWQSHDFSLLSKVISGLIFIFVSYFFYNYVQKYVEIDKAICLCILVQSFLIIGAICSESFYELTSRFRTVTDEHMATYGRLRGNAVAGYQFFSVATMYSFVIIYIFLHLDRFKYKYLTIPIIIIAGLCSGRFFSLSIFLGITINMFKNYLGGNKLKVICVFCGFVLLVWMSCIVMLNNYQKIQDPMLNITVEQYFIDPIKSITDREASFESASTNHLIEMYEEDKIKQHFLLGSGKYMNEDGSYFGNVDIGYYRMLGYYGYGGLVVLILSIAFLIFESNSNLDIWTKFAFFLNFLSLNFKGDVMIWSNNIIPIVIGFLFFSSNNNYSNGVNSEMP